MKEFCLATGGGYGDVDQKEGKFYIGAYLRALEVEEIKPGGAPREVAGDHLASAGEREKIIINTPAGFEIVSPVSRCHPS